jgi:hypothetical protein
MKLRSLVIRLIVVWIPILPPTPLIAKYQRGGSPTGGPVHLLVTAEARHSSEMSVINRGLAIVVQNSGG